MMPRAIRALRDERGVTLVEMLLASILSLLVMGASLAAFDALQGNHKLTQEHNEAQDVTRQQTDRLARELRNLASPSQLTSDLSAQPQAVDLAADYDLVFRVVDDVRPAGSLNAANVKRVRYCLNNTTPSNGVIWRQTQTWTTSATPALPSTAACPGTGWDATDTQYIGNVANRDRRTEPAHLHLQLDRPAAHLQGAHDPLRRSHPGQEPGRDPSLERRVPAQPEPRPGGRLHGHGDRRQAPDPQRLGLRGPRGDAAEVPVVPRPARHAAGSCPGAVSCLGEGVVFEKTGLSGGAVHTITLVVRDPANLAAVVHPDRDLPDLR